MAAVAIEIANAMRLMRTGEAAMSASATWSCATAMMARPMKVRLRNSSSAANRVSATRHGTSMRHDIGGLDVAVVDAKDEDERNLGDEQKAEEEGKPAQRFPAVFLEGRVIDLVDERTERIEHRQHDEACQDRINAEPRVHDIGDVGAENDETGMRDIDDIENAERHRNPDGHGGVEGAEQNPRGQRIEEKIIGNVHNLGRPDLIIGVAN